MRNLTPRTAFDRVTHHQAVVQRCVGFEPNSVEAGADRDITVTVEFENTRGDQSFDHVWRVEVDGTGIGFTTTHVPAGETVTDSQTQTIPEALLPVNGGSLPVVSKQWGGFEQTSRCGDLEVAPTQAEPVPAGDIVLTDLRVPSTVTEGETATIEIETRCVDGFCEQETLTLTVGGRAVFTGGSTQAGPFKQGRTRTFTANVIFDMPGAIDVVADLDGDRLTATVDVQAVAPTGPDPGLVSLDGSEIVPREVGPDEFFDLQVMLSNENSVDVSVDIFWRFTDGSPLLTSLSRTIPAGAAGHPIAAETSPGLARILPGQTVDVAVEVSNTDIGIALSGSCGQVSVTGGFDAADVYVLGDECTVSPQEVVPPQDVSLSATVINDNLFPAIAEVWWTWQGLRIAFVQVEVEAESRTTAQSSATIDREGRDQVRARVERASGGAA